MYAPSAPAGSTRRAMLGAGLVVVASDALPLRLGFTAFGVPTPSKPST